MSPRTLVGYFFGRADAIQRIATNRAALWAGITLVVLTGIPRNYDQKYVFETPLWLVGPLVFSFFSGSFVYWIVIRGFARRLFPSERKAELQWPTFMTLFWMTAPIAWLYAIPVERMFDSYSAAQANLTLLGVVSTWRVLLLSRVLALLLDVPFRRAFGWVLVAASLEVIAVIFIGGIFSPSFGQRVMAGMAGMVNAPEENLMTSALWTVWRWAWAVLLFAFVLVVAAPFHGAARPLPQLAPGKMPWTTLLALAVIWSLIALPAQMEQHRFARHTRLIDRQQYKEALAYLSKFKKSDFPPGRRLEPNPYEYDVWNHLPPTVALLTTNTPLWVRDLYLSHAAHVLQHPFSNYRSLTNVAAMFAAIERLPEGSRWVHKNQFDVARQRLRGRRNDNESLSSESAALTGIVTTLRRMGMAETNVAKLLE